MAFSIDPLRAGRLWLWFPVIDFTVTKLNFSQDKRKGRKGMKGWRTRGKNGSGRGESKGKTGEQGKIPSLSLGSVLIGLHSRKMSGSSWMR